MCFTSLTMEVYRISLAVTFMRNYKSSELWQNFSYVRWAVRRRTLTLTDVLQRQNAEDSRIPLDQCPHLEKMRIEETKDSKRNRGMSIVKQRSIEIKAHESCNKSDDVTPVPLEAG